MIYFISFLLIFYFSMKVRKNAYHIIILWKPLLALPKIILRHQIFQGNTRSQSFHGVKDEKSSTPSTSIYANMQTFSKNANFIKPWLFLQYSCLLGCLRFSRLDQVNFLNATVVHNCLQTPLSIFCCPAYLWCKTIDIWGFILRIRA